ncbi:hypothetical protein [Streptomyces europaeiscabiei]|uniref:hypothetical protein n=1 Tax=Streptomyces europaeiscabiei TaxID=146819 RepID=UPI002E135350|nr:hypothetical protein OHB30_33380 [Streptomyces europaeiscabiei]
MSGTGGSISTSSPDREFELLCDVAADGTATAFLRRVSVDGTGISTVLDTALDGTTPYTPTGTVGVCPAEVTDYEVLELCDVAADGTSTPFLRRLAIAEDGTVTFTDTALDGTTAYTPAGTVGRCTTEQCAKQVIERCGCDDTDGDGIGDVTYTELWAVDPCDGDAPVLLGTYLDGDLTQPYTPVAPVECTAADALPGPLSTGVRAVTGTAAHDLAAEFPTLQSVTLTVLSGSVLTTMSDGTSVAVPAGMTMTWSVAQDSDTALAAAAFTGATASTNYFLNWTWK